MWSHYADNHKVFVIGFDSENEFFHQKRSADDECNYIRKVQYSEDRPKIQLTSLEDMADILLAKSKEWEYEQEWRMLKPLREADETIQNNNEPICLFSFPPQCITEIIFGCRMSDSDKEEMLEYFINDKDYTHVEKYQAVLDEKEFRLNMVHVQE